MWLLAYKGRVTAKGRVMIMVACCVQLFRGCMIVCHACLVLLLLLLVVRVQDVLPDVVTYFLLCFMENLGYLMVV